MCGALIFVIWSPNPLWFRPISSISTLGNIVGPYGFLVLKQTKKKLKRLSWPRECKSVNGGVYPMLRKLIPELKMVGTRWVQRLR